ncbi:hypothetical protein LIER_22258 [Lithospermum erythrorhizon]|uniref:Maturase K n=1 Tax=Lithospermum erythrorhizon TaxID=34254 RepID=A0AAV3QTD6_LITER
MLLNHLRVHIIGSPFKADAEFGDIREEITLHDLLYFGYVSRPKAQGLVLKFLKSIQSFKNSNLFDLLEIVFLVDYGDFSFV